MAALQVLYRDEAEEAEASSTLLHLGAEAVVALVQYFEVLPQRVALLLALVGSLRSRQQTPSLLLLEKFSSSSSNWTS